VAGRPIRLGCGDHPGRRQQRTVGNRRSRRCAEPAGAGRQAVGCSDELAAVEDISRDGASYQRQRRVAEEHDGDLRAVVDGLVGELDI